jgi:acetyl-CoA/propionyl-CoA carboxylase biotin carboxyl carrier protein
LTAAERQGLHDAAVRIGSAAGLTNAATAEFLRGPDGSTYFLEVNTRLQVEHGVTELVTGLDLVREQFTLASGEPLSEAVRMAATLATEPARHAIEARLTAEDPSRAFSPTPGRIRHWVMPSGPDIRVDTGLAGGDRIPPEYDNLMAKIMAVGEDRAAAISALRRALDATEVAGVQTTLPFHRFAASHPGFARAELSTDWIETTWDGPGERDRVAADAARAAAGAVVEWATGRGALTEAGTASPAPSRSGWGDAAAEEAVDRWPG